MYSLVSAPVLGFDLTRLDGGTPTADVLLRALCLGRADLPVLARHRPDEDVRGQLWLDVDVAAIKVPTLRRIADDDADPARTLGLVERAPIGTLDALLHCVRTDVLDWTWMPAGTGTVQDEMSAAATSVVCDAVVSAYLRDLLPSATRRRLAGGWLAALRRLDPPDPIDLGPHHDAVVALLDQVRVLSPNQVERLARASDDVRRGPSGWSPAVHSASWAAYLCDRIRTAAAAQFMLVQAVETGGIPVAMRAAGIWNLLSGAVQALVVRDLLDTATAHRLLAPVVGALGPGWLR